MIMTKRGRGAAHASAASPPSGQHAVYCGVALQHRNTNPLYAASSLVLLSFNVERQLCAMFQAPRARASAGRPTVWLAWRGEDGRRAPRPAIFIITITITIIIIIIIISSSSSSSSSSTQRSGLGPMGETHIFETNVKHTL